MTACPRPVFPQACFRFSLCGTLPGRATMMGMDAEQRTRAALAALDGFTMRPELAAYWKAGADLAEQHKAQRAAAEAAISAKAAKFQKRRAALAKRKASVKEKLWAEERKFGAAIVKLLKTDAELRAVLLPKLQAALTNPQDKATLETLNGPARRVILAKGSPVRSGAGRQTTLL